MQNQVSTILLLVAAVTVVIEIQHLREDVESPNDGRSSINHNIDKPEVAYHKSNVQIETCNTRSPKQVCFQPVLLRFFLGNSQYFSYFYDFRLIHILFDHDFVLVTLDKADLSVPDVPTSRGSHSSRKTLLRTFNTPTHTRRVPGRAADRA